MCGSCLRVIAWSLNSDFVIWVVKYFGWAFDILCQAKVRLVFDCFISLNGIVYHRTGFLTLCLSGRQNPCPEP
jgi:hypothetical protein